MNRFCLSVVILTVLVSFSAGVSSAQEEKKKRTFKIEKFLKRLDANQNGMVEPSEIKDDRTRNFLEKSGADTSKAINIKSYAKNIKKKRTERENPSASQKTSGFAVTADEREDEGGDTPGFAVSEEERQPVERVINRQFSDGAKQMLDWVLKNYDKNKDGKIDSQEIKAGRWADPPASVSDTNKDGSLSKMELLVRYQKREDEKAKKDKSRESRSRSRSRDRSRDSSGNRSSRSSSSNSSEKSGGRDVRKGYESYVNGLFKNYDKNKDGFLDKDEVEKMRRKPDPKADKDNDKKISKSELIDSYLEKAGHKSSSKGSSSRSKTKSGSGRTGSYSSGSSSGAGFPDSRPPLTDKDKNKNGQLEMSEFETKWTAEKIAEFKRIDKNSDGVITKAEWDKR